MSSLSISKVTTRLLYMGTLSFISLGMNGYISAFVVDRTSYFLEIFIYRMLHEKSLKVKIFYVFQKLRYDHSYLSN